MTIAGRKYLVTGGTGFIGSALVRALVRAGARVRCLDDDSRGSRARLADVKSEIEFVDGDIRDAGAVNRAARGMESICHLAFVNGTEFFYTKPELVLDVAVKGMINVLDAAIAQRVPELVLASSSEVYQTPPSIPTDERVPLVVPDPWNPRYSYGGGKIISELMTINYGRQHFERAMIFRPHNVYGPDMGWEHVIPQLSLKVKRACSETGRIDVQIQGSGDETRAFVFVDDLVRGVLCMLEKGEHLAAYHIGTEDEVTIRTIAERIGRCFGRDVNVVPSPVPTGATPRRCPDISKLRGLGYTPRVPLEEGLPVTVRWYDENAHRAPQGGN
jgi:nucleoside-diphosphate-sugar epimerase